jgi:predicted alpha-1,2-mannosidase
MRLGFSICCVAVLALSAAFLSLQNAAAQKTAAPYDLVDPFIGTAGGGNTFPGATLPFGMVQWSPDTGQDAWYRYHDKSIYGFSLTHVSGAGCPLYGDFAVLPVPGRLTASPGADPGADLAPYAQPFDHSNEQAHPGYYAVTLSSGVRVEITVTERAGIARFIFPAGTPARLLVNSGSSTHGNGGASRRKDAEKDENGLELSGPQGFSAWSHAGHFCSSNSHYTIHAAGSFDRPFTSTALWQNDAVLPDAKSARGTWTGAWLDFGNAREVTLKIGISFVSQQGAQANLDKEIPHWSFDSIHTRAQSVWETLLNRFASEGGTDNERKIFYTGVYHSFLSPNLFSDEDGQYMGFDLKPHSLAGSRQHAQYANFSDWDIYRNTVQLQALFFPQESSDMMQSLVNDAEQGGQLPRWEAANDVTYVMGGDSPVPVIVSAYAFGARNFDAETALKHMVKAATETDHNRERPRLKQYLTLGYVPSDDRIGASMTLEYASDDFAIAQLAKALGHAEIAEKFLKQSENWKNLLDPETGWIRPRLADGTWLQSFDAERSLPKGNNSDQWGFEEGNTYQYTFMIPFDYPALFAAIGGEQKVTPRLDRFFVKLRCWGRPCYNIENEPDFVAPYAYVFAGQPWKTQEVVTRIGKETFKVSAEGIPGNDDLGATSGVYVWNALGFYPAVPGIGGLAIGTPLFPHITLRLAEGRTLDIHKTSDGIYVSQFTLNGTPYANLWLPLEKLRAGTTRIVFTTQAEPDTHRGTAAADRPPAFR